jgi:uncharacterized protein YqgC (DUF456 family)
MLFLPWGLLLGPLAGAFTGEIFFAKKKVTHAASSGIGSVVGTITGMAVKILIGILMIIWFFADVFWIGT